LKNIDVNLQLPSTSIENALIGPTTLAELFDKYEIAAGVVADDALAFSDFVRGNLNASAALSQEKRALGWVLVNPGYVEISAEEMRKYLGHSRFVGISLHPGDATSSDDITAILNAHRRYGKPAHVWITEPDQVSFLGEIAPDLSPMKFVITARDWASWRKAVTVAARRPSFMLETSGEPFRERIRVAIAELGPHRVLFGSGAPEFSPALASKLVEASNLTEEQRMCVCYQNAIRAFPWLAR
jgi:predicted TIM-barrel fold metal-dependent hydrolase